MPGPPFQVTNDILHNEGAGMEAHYFAAQTLRTKVGAPATQPQHPPRPRQGAAWQLCVGVLGTNRAAGRSMLRLAGAAATAVRDALLRGAAVLGRPP